MTGVVTSLGGADAMEIFGSVGAMKLRSSMTLFVRAAPADELFPKALEKFFGGVADEATLSILRRAEAGADA